MLICTVNLKTQSQTPSGIKKVNTFIRKKSKLFLKFSKNINNLPEKEKNEVEKIFF